MNARSTCAVPAYFSSCGRPPSLAGKHHHWLRSKRGPSQKGVESATRFQFSAFTLTELLVVITIVAVIVALLLLALFASKAKAQAVFCLNNYRQLQTAWRIYVSDHNDRVPPNEGLNRFPSISKGFQNPNPFQLDSNTGISPQIFQSTSVSRQTNQTELPTQIWQRLDERVDWSFSSLGRRFCARTQNALSIHISFALSTLLEGPPCHWVDAS